MNNIKAFLDGGNHLNFNVISEKLVSLYFIAILRRSGKLVEIRYNHRSQLINLQKQIRNR